MIESDLKLVDRYGLTFKECLGFQEERLTEWQDRVYSEIWEEVKAYCIRTNVPARDLTQKHQVYRGADVDALMREWPEINEALYVPKDPKVVIPAPLNPNDLV